MRGLTALSSTSHTLEVSPQPSQRTAVPSSPSSAPCVACCRACLSVPGGGGALPLPAAAWYPRLRSLRVRCTSSL